MRKLIACCLLLTFLLPYAVAEDDEDFALTDLVQEEVMLEDDGSETPTGPDAWLEADGSVLLTMTFTGDFTVGKNAKARKDIFNAELQAQGGDINFTMRNMRDILLADDMTLVNFEGTLTNSTFIPSNKKNNSFLFSAPPEYVSMLSDNGVECVSLENNHIMDHGEEAYEDTKNALRNAGIVYSNSTEWGVYTVKGVDVCMISYLCIDRYESLWDKVPADIAAAKAQYPIVIVSFHWGVEKDYVPTSNQIRMGRLAVDAGADLVIGHHSHRIQPIECYKGVYICYSLGNFCFAGNNKPDDMSSIVFQTRFRIREGEVINDGFRIIPIRISSRRDRNDFIPTPLTDATHIDGVVTTLKSNGRKLQYAVPDYPLKW
ncbi:MAG: CapA family protein [Clostridia bacterium]|nr:CapA family protein [Clostridia bacterium]